MLTLKGSSAYQEQRFKQAQIGTKCTRYRKFNIKPDKGGFARPSIFLPILLNCPLQGVYTSSLFPE